MSHHEEGGIRSLSLTKNWVDVAMRFFVRFAEGYDRLRLLLLGGSTLRG